MTESIIAPELVALDVSAGTDKSEVIAYLAGRITDAGRSSSVDGLVEAALAREAQSATGLPGGIAIPHCRAAAVTAASLGFARLDPKVDFGAPDGGADLVFLIAAPESGGSQHMKLLSALARALVRPEFTAALRAAATPEEVVALVEEVIAPKPAEPKPAAPAAAPAAAAAAAPAPAAEPAPSGKPSLVAITACPTGIAHTYMAADALKLAAERAGVELTVETQGSSGSTPLSAQTIADAGAVLFATDVGVKGRERFAGKPVITSGVKRGINEPDAMIAEAVAAASDPHAATVDGDAAASAESAPAQQGLGGQLKRALLTGVSYMIPFVAAGGLLIALGFLLGGYEIGNSTVSEGTSDGAYFALHNSLWNLPPGGLLQYLGSVSFATGQAAMSLMVAVLAGYIAYAIADRPGLAPGFVAGVLAVTVNAGFIGGVVGGLLAGVVALWIGKLQLPQWARGLMPVVIIPLFATLITGGLMYMVLAGPLRWVNESMTDALNGMSGSSKIALGVVLGLMMCFDLGGPVNKAAYAFGVAGIGLSTAGVPQWEMMAAVMAAGMVPPLALALASTVLRPGLFTEPERENGKAAWFLGASFISEGAIPFAAADPLRVIPSMMLGGAVTGGLSMALGAQLRAPHGGVFVLFAMNGTWWKFLIALAAGVVVSAVAVVAAKSVGRQDASAAESAQPAAVAA
ncbi:EIIABC-Fru (plasmid) [Tsukamurella tyrosinosolvens]|uniref:PTS system D-fructose-specific IIA component (F1P-forming), Frc family /PTS system D-fructose-specific IIB component (F1P-forming), Frc family /PTS system D-fructose-specific IIC component (F1P-for... n=1 Tax=Tsukamurella tyrosinosolvens TaxID=57704 RepID=A0A1H4LEA5_TSUTY|nr:fructose-specific PTS transporter subunit EIIC [Tsukamurella tyrosinosolvens]AUN38866.1 PTS lactose transporter subunit IIC [Tsukamurella tyrosinosolvens]KXO96577.1 PTS lactose transporter subunit IIC [Tsukamurella tyrosinosolvens]SEB68592.1 PTS system D-fructose-specific IIA component (F1P-forming), Frc family /PTS system D-fructose-specific IIB component (F1P-forming), Frc family /PTS system D-fructose-specific IIC component (F1P-forming), Frc family [Tsukamurella tyrosinosolvens]VEH93416.